MEEALSGRYAYCSNCGKLLFTNEVICSECGIPCISCWWFLHKKRVKTKLSQFNIEDYCVNCRRRFTCITNNPQDLEDMYWSGKL